MPEKRPRGASLFVKDFDAHILQAEGFHRRWMGSKEAVLDWCERASKLEIDMLCPQHGAIYQGAAVVRNVIFPASRLYSHFFISA